MEKSTKNKYLIIIVILTTLLVVCVCDLIHITKQLNETQKEVASITIKYQDENEDLKKQIESLSNDEIKNVISDEDREKLKVVILDCIKEKIDAETLEKKYGITEEMLEKMVNDSNSVITEETVEKLLKILEK